MRRGAPSGAQECGGVSRADAQPADVVRVEGIGAVDPFEGREGDSITGLGGEGPGPRRVGTLPSVGIGQRRDLAPEPAFQDTPGLGQLPSLGILVEPGQLAMGVPVRADRQRTIRAGERSNLVPAREQGAGQGFAVHGDFGPREELIEEPSLVGDAVVEERTDDRHDRRRSRHQLQVDGERRCDVVRTPLESERRHAGLLDRVSHPVPPRQPRRFEERGGEEERRGDALFAEDRDGDFEVVAVSIVEGDQGDRLAPGGARVEHREQLVEGQDPDVSAQPGHLGAERLGRRRDHRIVERIGGRIGDPVIG